VHALGEDVCEHLALDIHSERNYASTAHGLSQAVDAVAEMAERRVDLVVDQRCERSRCGIELDHHKSLMAMVSYGTAYGAC
jgi:hypothetical protein